MTALINSKLLVVFGFFFVTGIGTILHGQIDQESLRKKIVSQFAKNTNFSCSLEKMERQLNSNQEWITTRLIKSQITYSKSDGHVVEERAIRRRKQDLANWSLEHTVSFANPRLGGGIYVMESESIQSTFGDLSRLTTFDLADFPDINLHSESSSAIVYHTIQLPSFLSDLSLVTGVVLGEFDIIQLVNKHPFVAITKVDDELLELDCLDIEIDVDNGDCVLRCCPHLDYSIVSIDIRRNAQFKQRNGKTFEQVGVNSRRTRIRMSNVNSELGKFRIDRAVDVELAGGSTSHHQSSLWVSEFQTEIKDDDLVPDLLIPNGTVVETEGGKAIWQSGTLVHQN